MELAHNVRVIPPTRPFGLQETKDKEPKTRVAAYCRVSTDTEEQESSYEVQVEHYTTYIKNNPEWEFVKIYADDGISGTNTAKRDAFNEMIRDCRAGKIDLILTKSISRFSRNTVDCLKYTRELKDLNIAVFFEKENINTLDAKGEVLITIMAALAQQESESLSANVRLGIQFRNQQGKVQVNHKRFLGYTKDEDGNLIIVPEEAEVVKRIYAEYLEGASLLQIKKNLEADHILTGAGNRRWHESNIKQILKNEKYIGDALLQKTYTINTLEKKRIINNGVVPKYYVEGDHEAIIPKEIFLQVQAELQRRSKISADGNKRGYCSKYALTGIVACGCCGSYYRRLVWSNRYEKVAVWRCVSRVEKGKRGTDCTARTMRESELQNAIVTAVNDAWSKKDHVIPILKRNMEIVLNQNWEEQLQEIEEELLKEQRNFVKFMNDREKSEKVRSSIEKLQRKQEEIMMKSSLEQARAEQINNVLSFLDTQTEAITEYSDALVRRLIEKITVYDEMIVVEFKSGVSIMV